MEQEKLIERVSLLNKKIKKINMERVVIESKRELLVETLNKQVAEYKKKTGVDLAGKSVKEIYSKATTEYNKLYEEINAEYETQRKVVDCIECGDINEAKRLLGMDVDAGSEAKEETESVEEAVEELEVGDDFELEVEDSEESEDLEDYEEETLEKEDSEEENEDESAKVEDGFADLEIEEIDLDDLGVEPEEVEVKEEPKKAKKTKKGMDNPFDKTDDIFDFVEKAEKKAGAKKVDEKKAEEKEAGDTGKVKAEKKAKAEPKKAEKGVEGLADFFEDDDEILDFADGIDGLSLDFN